MDDSQNLQRFHRVILTAGIATLVVYALAVGAALSFFRGEVRGQILQRDGVLLTSVSQHFYDQLEDPGDGVGLLDVALESSDISGVIGVRIYDFTGDLIARVPAVLYEVNLPAADLSRMAAGKPLSRHYARYSLEALFADLFDLEESAVDPVTEVLVPVRGSDGKPVAIIQYWLDGAEVSAEMAQLDHFLVGLGLVFIVAGGLIFVAVFLYARQRLLSMGRLLADRNRSLQKANEELALAARTSAIGSVTGHLFHGLKNPLAGLKSYLRLIVRDEEAVALAEHMQSMIDETLAVLREEGAPAETSLSFDEYVDLVRSRFDGKTNGRVRIEAAGSGSIPARKAQLSFLVLRNLVDNALEVSASGAPVLIHTKMDEHSLRVVVEDHGPGLPDKVRRRLFEPVVSDKANGTGIGLAISAVISRHIPARLHLQQTGPDGTAFLLEIPK